MAWSLVKGFLKMYIFHFLDNFFWPTFLLYNWILQKNLSIFANLQIFLQILKEEHKSFPMMYHLSYFDINMGFRGWGVKLTLPPPQRILVFKFPSRDRVNMLCCSCNMQGYLTSCFLITCFFKSFAAVAAY